jgi:hypothetical protein
MKLFLKLSKDQYNRQGWIKLSTNNFYVSYDERNMSGIYSVKDFSQYTHERFFRWFYKN